MKEEENLLKINLSNPQEKEGSNKLSGYKLYFFRALYSIEKYHGKNKFCDILFTIIQFLQLMAFPMDKIFSPGWGDYWFGTVGNFFRFFQLIFLWEGNTPFYIISFIIVCIYILLLLIFFLHILINSKSISLKNKNISIIICNLLQFEIVLNIPIFKTLFGIFTCKGGGTNAAPDIKCHNGIHICLIIISIIFILIFTILIILFHITLYEFGVNPAKLKAAYTSSTEVLLDIAKLILILLYQFVTNETALSIITFFISLILFFHFISTKPFSSGFTMKLYISLYLFFLWASIICLISIFLEESKFEGGVILYIIGFPIILFSVFFKELDFSIDKIFEFITLYDPEGYKDLLQIEYFLRFEENLSEKIRTKQQKVLYSYINNFERNCIVNDCPLKQFMKIPLKVENFIEMKICLLQHGESLYKTAISKHPYNTKLRISYGTFLFYKMNKKLKGVNEISLLDKFNSNLEDSFLAYKARRFLKDEESGEINLNDHDEQATNFVDSLSYKSILNNIKSLINQITINYIDFWTILAISDKNKTKNFLKMSKIGTKIRLLSDELLEHIKKLEIINIYDQDIFKLYIQYLSEILSNTSQANSYHNKIMENDQSRHQYSEENLFELNYKEMSKSEDYNYIIINFSPLKFNTISNLSYSACKTFGFTKEELIGRSYDILLPDMFCYDHSKIIDEKIEDFKKKLLLVKNGKVRSDSWIDGTFGKNKMKYLVPFKTRWTLVTSEDEIIYGIGNITSDSTNFGHLERDIIYVLTDKNLIIQGFTPNAHKFLYLYSNAINNNLNITDYIRELSDEYASMIENGDDIKESNINMHSDINSSKIRHKNLKYEILKQHFFTKKNTRKLIHWKVNEVMLSKFIKPGAKFNFAEGRRQSLTNIEERKCQSAFHDYSAKNFKKQNNSSNSLRKFNLMNFHPMELETTIIKKNQKNSYSHIVDTDKSRNSKLINLDELNFGGTIVDEKILKNLYFRPIQHKLYLSIKEAKIHGHKVGYLFRFEPTKQKNLEHKISTIKKFELSSLNNKDIPDIEKSELSVMSFADISNELKKGKVPPTIDNPFGINTEGGDYFFKSINTEKDTQFTLDINTMSYKQLGKEKEEKNNNKNILYEELRKQAVEKIEMANELIKGETQEEEESSSSMYSDDSDEDVSSGSKLSSKRKNDDLSSQDSKEINSPVDEKSKKKDNLALDNENSAPSIRNSVTNFDTNNPVNNINNIFDNNKQTNITKNSNKKKEDDFYQVDMTNITLYIYNFQSGFVEAFKDQKYKISQVTKTFNQERENIGKSNAKFLANPKLAKEKKKGNANKKINNDEDEDNAFTEQKMKLKEIQKALSSKEKQTTIINLCIFSFLIFVITIGTSVMSILINYYLKDSAYTFYILIIKSIQLYKNILYEITYVKEMLMINNTLYNQNFFFHPKEAYYEIFSNLVYDYYIETSYILTNITNNIHVLTEEQENALINQNISLFIIDPVLSNETMYQYKEYQVLVYSAYRELNSALYHISMLKLDEIYTYDDNVYYFIKNGMSNLIVESEKQMNLLTNLFSDKTKYAKIISIICCVVNFILYILFYFIFIHFYKKVEERKQSYLSVFYEIENRLIVLSLSKCEKFLHKLQLQENSLAGKGEKFSLDYFSFDDSDMEHNIQNSNLLKQNKEKTTLLNKEEKTSNFLIKSKIFGFILFLILLMWQLATYIYYIIRLTTYEDCIQYEYHTSLYASNFIFPFIAMREYIFNKKNIFYNETIDKYIDDTLLNFYVNLTSSSNDKDQYQSHFPTKFKNFLDDLYTDKICELILEFNQSYPNNGFTGCGDFFYGTAKFGFYSVLAMYIEEIRTIRDYVDNLYLEAEKNNFAYNESYFQDPKGNYERFKQKYNTSAEVFNKYERLNPAHIFSTDTHKTLLIVYRFIISNVFTLLIDESIETFEEMFSETNQVSLIINIVFIIVVSVGFLLIWLPFVLEENETIFKTKNMLSIIPNEILINLPNINIMLGIEEQKA